MKRFFTRHSMTGLALVLTTAQASAEPMPGCYMRIYDEAHLAAQPQQWVEGISMWIQPDQINDFMRAASMSVLKRDAAPTDQILMMAVTCRDGDGGLTICTSWCGNDAIEITSSDAQGLTFRTGRFIVSPGAECSGGRDLAETPGQATAYRLDKVEDGLCG